MKVTLDFDSKVCIVEREASDPKFYDSGWGTGESRLFYHVKQALQAQGHDVIKKLMHKDGHLVDQWQQYIRSRSASCYPNFAIMNQHYSIEGAEVEFNRKGIVKLMMISPYFMQPEKEKDMPVPGDNHEYPDDYNPLYSHFPFQSGMFYEISGSVLVVGVNRQGYCAVVETGKKRRCDGWEVTPIAYTAEQIIEDRGYNYTLERLQEISAWAERKA